MAFWTMSRFVLEIGRDVHRGVRDQQGTRIARHVHQIDVAEPSAGAKTAVWSQYGMEQFVGVQRALHQQRRLAPLHQANGRNRRRLAIRDIDQPERCDIHFRRFRRVDDSALRPDQNRSDQTGKRRFDRRAESVRVAGVSDRRRRGACPAAAASSARNRS